MEFQHQTEEEKPIYLKYQKRRYDGGTEMDLIRYLEAKQALRSQAIKNLQDVKGSPLPSLKRTKRSKKILEALILGPMELAIGAVGMLTTLLAIVVFHQQSNTVLLKQSQVVFQDCVKTFAQGGLHLLTGPWKAVKVAVVGT